MDQQQRRRWQAEYIDAVDFKPEGPVVHTVVRVGWAPWSDAEGRPQPRSTTWEPVRALGLGWQDLRDLVRPDAELTGPRHGLTAEERAALRAARMLLGVKKRRRSRESPGRGRAAQRSRH